MNLAVLEDLELQKGSHDAASKEMCLLEAVAFVAGEPWSDNPKCASPLLADYGRRLNDRLSHALRQELKPLIPMLVGSVGDDATEERRSVMLADWYIREHLPRLLTYSNLEGEAQKLFSLPALTRENTQAAINAVRAAGWAARAAWAARDARDARDAWAAWDARDARDARDAWAARAAWDARAARDARDARAAWDARAARDARDAWDARDACFDLTAQAQAKVQGVELLADTIPAVMEPIITEIARSQIDIFRRMIEAGPHGPTINEAKE